jgi:hypothetical protein
MVSILFRPEAEHPSRARSLVGGLLRDSDGRPSHLKFSAAGVPSGAAKVEEPEIALLVGKRVGVDAESPQSCA